MVIWYTAGKQKAGVRRAKEGSLARWTWNKRQLGMVIARVGAVSLVREGDEDVLIVLYEWLERNGFVERTCRIPVPNGKRAEAADAGQKIAEAGGVKFGDVLAWYSEEE